MGQVQSFGILNKGSGLWPSGFTRQATSARLTGDVIQVWINSLSSNRCISHFKTQLVQLFFIQHLKCTYWIKGILCGYAIWSGRHPEGSQRPPGRPQVGPSRWLPYCIYRKISNIRRTLVGNKFVHHSDEVGASPVSAAPTTSSFST